MCDAFLTLSFYRPGRYFPARFITGVKLAYLNNLNHKLQCCTVADDLFDEISSQSSSHSGAYSNVHFVSGSEHENNMSPAGGDKHPISKCHKSTRFCPEENRNAGKSLAKCKSLLASGSIDRRTMDSRILMRNRSLVDVRSQLLHRSLVEEVNRRRLFKTVGAVENIGFHAPCEVSAKLSKSSSGAACNASSTRNEKGQWH